MRSKSNEAIFVMTAIAAVTLMALVSVMVPDLAQAADQTVVRVTETSQAKCTCSAKPEKPSQGPLAAIDRTLATEPKLTQKDEIFVLKAIHHALSEMGDGSPFVWRQPGGRLAGLTRPTRSFRADNGQICRHLIVLLTTGYRTSKMEGLACRLDSGRWRFES